ncbi:MAG: hypothetical protein ACRDPH_15185 [Marmoricola sp.]
MRNTVAGRMWVPRWTQAPTKLTQTLPRRLQGALERLSDSKDVLGRADSAARAAYEERARRSAR